MDEKKFSKLIFIIGFFIIGFWVTSVCAQIILPPATGFSFESVTPNPWGGASIFNQKQSGDLFSSSNIINKLNTNPISTTETHFEEFKNLSSSAFSTTSSFSDIWGTNKQSGNAGFATPYFQSGGKYLDFNIPGGSFSTDSSFYSGLTGGGSGTSSNLKMPWFEYGTSLASESSSSILPTGFGGAVSMQNFGGATQHVALGYETPFSLTMSSPVAAMYTLREFAPQIGAMDRVLSDNAMYTESGMKFYATSGYYNPASSSNWFFPEQVSTSGTQVTTVGGVPVSGHSYVTGIGSSTVAGGVAYGAPPGAYPSGIGGAYPVGIGGAYPVGIGGAYPASAPSYGGVVPGGGVISTGGHGVPNFSYGVGL